MEKPNKIERIKTQQSASKFWEKIETFDWHHPSEADRFYLKSFGIYTIKIRPEAWMIRLRIDGGNLPTVHAKTLADLAKRHSLSLLLTARSQLELHGLSAETVYHVYQALHIEGIETQQTLTDNVRAIVTDPLDGLTPDSHILCHSIIDAIREHIVGHPEWMGTLPRKFNTALIGRETPSFNPWGNDLLFALARKEGTWGFNLYLGGKNSETAQSANVFCPPEHVSDCFMAVIHLYRQHGLRGSRAKIRLFHLIETVGMDQIRLWLQEFCPYPLQSAGALQMRSSTENTDHFLPVERYGTHGEITPETLSHITQKAKQDTLTLRLTPHQELWLFDPNDIAQSTHKHKSGVQLHALQSINHSPSTINQSPITNHESPITKSPSTIDHQPSTNLPHSSLVTHKATSCAGSRYCGLSLWDIKRDTETLPLHLLTKHGISLGFSGCLKGCGRHYHSDIGLIGLRTNLYGETERAVRIFLGAVQVPDPTPARMIYYSVPERCLEGLFRVMIEDFERSGFETFEGFNRDVLNRYSVELLQAWYLVRQLFEIEEEVYRIFLAGNDENELWSALEMQSGFPSCDERYEAIREMTHRLWDV